MFSHVGTKPSIIMESKICTSNILNLNRMDYWDSIERLGEYLRNQLGVHSNVLTPRLLTTAGIWMVRRL